ncbi:MAG: hypothetical protein HBSAPP03_18730 [Phycisphaerae bacterium]|nr:MAG: hypothetical protein HBSAPP03_18730 [Phycisphaerae bacterium]
MLPVLVVIGTGLLLLVKKDVAWVQPPQAVGTGLPPAVSFEQVLEAARSVPEAGVGSWADVERMDVRVKDGLIKVVSRGRWEVQVCASTGAVLGSAYRRSDLIESLHDGTWFHANAKYLVMLPSGLVLLGLWLTGVYLWVLPVLARQQRATRYTGTTPP